MQKKIGTVVTKNGKVFQANLIGKNENFYDINSAQDYYNKTRFRELAQYLVREEYYHPEFKSTLIEIMKFQNPVNLSIWHKKSQVVNEETGESISNTWENMCYFNRQFTVAEMYTCVEILRRATPIELVSIFSDDFLEFSKDILKFFNEFAYPKVMEIVNEMEDVAKGMDEQVCKPIKDKIYADLKIMAKIPLTEHIEFFDQKIAK